MMTIRLILCFFAASFMSTASAAATPETLVSGLSYANALSFNGDYLYFGEQSGATGTLNRVHKGGGDKIVITSGTSIKAAGTGGGIVKIDFSSSHIYYGFGDYNSTFIEEVSYDGSEKRLLRNITGGYFIGIVESNIHYFENFRTLLEQNISLNTSPKQIASYIWPRSSPRDGDSYFLIDYWTRNLYKFDPLSGLPPQAIITNNGSEGLSFTNGTTAFVGFNELIKYISKDGGDFSILTLPPGGLMRGVDDLYIYYSINNIGLWRRPLNVIGPDELLVDDTVVSDSGVISDGVYIYWVDIKDGLTQGKLYRMSVGSQGLGIFGDPSQTAELNGVLDTPVPYTGNPLPQTPLIDLGDTRKRNVTVLVHGWNSEKSVWAEDTVAIIKERIGQNKLCKTSTANPCWDVWGADWKEAADTALPLGAWVAASDVGAAIARDLEVTYGSRLNYLHLVAHSAGSNVIQYAAKKLEDNKRNGGNAPASLHMTFLDPYTPVNAGGVLSYGDVDNSLIPTFSDSYVTAAASPSNLLASITPLARILMQETNQSLFHAYNFEVSNLDTVTTASDVLAWAKQDHAWPYQFYQCSANPEAYFFIGVDSEPCPVGNDDVYSIGFPLSQESGYAGSIQTLRHDYMPNRGCVAISPALCLDFADGASQVVNTVVQTTVDAAQTTVSATGRADVWVDKQLYDFRSQAYRALFNFTLSRILKMPLFSGSPVWVRLPVTISEPANYLRFDFNFTQGTEGYLQVFIHGKRIYSANQQFFAGNTVWHSPEIGIGDLEPGTYEIAFRLDPLTNTQSVVELTNLSVGRLEAVALPNQVPIAYSGVNRTVRLGSLVTLDGSASSDPDNSPAPLSYTWTEVVGPGTTLNHADSVNPVFIPNGQGVYRFGLSVNDGADSSAPSEVEITVPRLGDIDLDGDVDNNDLNQILAARNKPATGPNDLRDLDGNMMIDALDARKLTNLCTRSRCVTQ